MRHLLKNEKSEIIGISRSTGIVKITQSKCKNSKCDGWIRYQSSDDFNNFEVPFMYPCEDCEIKAVKP